MFPSRFISLFFAILATWVDVLVLSLFNSGSSIKNCSLDYVTILCHMLLRHVLRTNRDDLLPARAFTLLQPRLA